MGIFSSIFGNGTVSEENKFDTLRDDGVRALQMGELPYAAKCFQAALERQRDQHVLCLLAEVYLRMENPKEALPLLEEMTKESTDLELHLLLAQTQGDLKLYADEQQTCRTLLTQHPEEPRVLYLAAEAEQGLDQPFPAIAFLTQCLTLRPDYERALLLRARILSGMGQWNEALQDTNALIQAQPEHEDYLLLHAQICTALERWEEAQKDLEKLLELNPFQGEAVLLLGAIYCQCSLWDKALTLYNEAIDLRPDFADAYKARGAVKHHLKDDVGAAEDLKHSLELAPEKAAKLDGQYTNVENEMKARYRSMNPYGFSI